MVPTGPQFRRIIAKRALYHRASWSPPTQSTLFEYKFNVKIESKSLSSVTCKVKSRWLCGEDLSLPQQQLATETESIKSYPNV